MTYLVAAYTAGLLIIGLYAVHLGRSLRRARRWSDPAGGPPDEQGIAAGR